MFYVCQEFVVASRRPLQVLPPTPQTRYDYVVLPLLQIFEGAFVLDAYRSRLILSRTTVAPFFFTMHRKQASLGRIKRRR